MTAPRGVDRALIHDLLAHHQRATVTARRAWTWRYADGIVRQPRPAFLRRARSKVR